MFEYFECRQYANSSSLRTTQAAQWRQGARLLSHCRPHTLELRCPSLPLPLHNFISHNKTSSSSTLRLQPWVSIVGSLILTASIHLGHPRSVFDALHSACCCHHLKAKFGRGCKTRHRWLSSASHSAAKYQPQDQIPGSRKDDFAAIVLGCELVACLQLLHIPNLHHDAANFAATTARRACFQNSTGFCLRVSSLSPRHGNEARYLASHLPFSTASTKTISRTLLTINLQSQRSTPAIRVHHLETETRACNHVRNRVRTSD